MPNQNYESAAFYLDLINKRLDIKTHLGGQDTRSGIISEDLGGEIGHLFPNMSMLYSAIFTAHCLIEHHERVQKQKINSLETKAHYWEKFGKPLYDKQNKRKITRLRKLEAKSK